MEFIKANGLTDGISGRVGNKIVSRIIKGVTIAGKSLLKFQYETSVLIIKSSSQPF